MGRVLKTYPHIITSPYGKRGNSWHGGVDITGYNNGIHVLDYICAKAKLALPRENSKKEAAIPSPFFFLRVI